jgi:ATP-dependent Clp protease adaptor protein ClpS
MTSIGFATADTGIAVIDRPKIRRKEKPKKEPRFHVILWNDDVHTYEYVILMLQNLFGYPIEKGFMLAKEVDTMGKAIIFTSSLEQAELKRDQILAYGPDPLMMESTGPLVATLEKAPEAD